MVEVRPVLTKKDLKTFIMLPFRLYKHDPNWVAPLIGEQKKFFNPKYNSYYEHSEVALFLAWENGKPIGRISAQTNTQHNLEHKDKVGFFGFFECEDNQAAADALFEAALKWNKERGRDTLRGPMNLSVNDECGLLVKGFDKPPFIMMTYNPPYYEKLILGTGFHQVKDLYAYYLERTTIPERIEKAALQIMQRKNFTVRTLSTDKQQQKKDIETVFKIYREAWQYNWGAVPLTDGELKQVVRTLLPIVDPDLVQIAEVNGKPAGFSLALPNYNEVLSVMHGRVNPVTMIKAYFKSKHISSARVITLGVIREYQKRGIDIVFHYNSYKNGLPKGFFKTEFSWILDDNVMMIREAEMLNAELYKIYRLYDKPIG
ncbi:MAG TPA: GNAT family N-acetyltransferase [Candidatus Cloacimonadota bacterium]|mgnify:CR=1 FL=1|nr:GNAT family N-acetyltransferase [Candidatus Cloacimonadota bacterium]HOV16940.1 GNAT family N-acetyltransferase [Candidatus Cloacimonadota bacterium]HQL15095.1 GNAT family N-acetyltransferase [Candidatus Cloacimonadota bacterium]